MRALKKQKFKILEGDKKDFLVNQNFNFNLISNLSLGVLVINLKTKKIEFVNSKFSGIFNYKTVELIGTSYETFLSNNEKLDKKTLNDVLEVKTSAFYEDVYVYTKDKKLKCFNVTTSVDLEQMLILFHEVTEKKELEKKLIEKTLELKKINTMLEQKNLEIQQMQEICVQAGKFKLLAEVSSGIAHELNQPLTTVKGFTQEIIRELKENYNKEEIMFLLNEVMKGTEKMESIIKNMRELTRNQTQNAYSNFKEINFLELILKLFKTLEYQFSKNNISLNLHYNQNENYLIYSNEVALEQIFINLLSNAKDAILEKKIINGKVDVCLEISLDKKFLKIKVEDNGIGMTKDIQEKIFNPFFTTKEVGKGMGLGLSISYGLLQQLHGSIMVSSKLGVGSVFTVQLPLNPKNF